MRVTAIFLATSLVVLAGCERERAQPVSIGATRLGVSFGDDLDELRRSRPSVEYAPYAGWMEDLRQDSTFQHAIYMVGGAIPTEKPIKRGKIKAVKLIGRSLAVNTPVLRELDHSVGSRQYRGCTPVPGRNGPEEIAVLMWSGTDQSAVAEILMINAGTPQMKEPLSVTLAPPGTNLEEIGIKDLSQDCFSKSRFP